jgi:hypothetical protein
MGGGILSWAIQMRAAWRAELRGGAWDASFGGKGGMPELLSLWRFSRLAGGMRPGKGDLCYRPTS